ncbi:MAG TPA: hypothetical protein DD490_00640, partial [Acidobacteria bacterium]|nr:hypothetical protein [Acidobacteriota bacterium]
MAVLEDEMIYRLVVGAALCLLALCSPALQAQTITFLDENGAPATELLDGGPVGIRLTAPSLDTTPGRDGTYALASSVLGGGSIAVTLRETGPATGVFEGFFDLLTGGSWGSGLTTGTVYQPATRDTVNLEHNGTGSQLTASATLVGNRIRFVDAWGRDSTSFAAGQQV